MSRALPILFTAIATSAIAEPVPIDGQALTAMMSGATIRLDTPLGTTVPVHYGDNGQVWGEAGSVAFALGAPADRGRWWVDNNRLCHRWTIWFDRENQCLRLRQDGTRLFWVRDDGKTGTATLVSRPQPTPVQVAQHDQTAQVPPSSPPQKPAPLPTRPAPVEMIPVPAAKTPAIAAPAAKLATQPRAKREPEALPKATHAASAVRTSPLPAQVADAKLPQTLPPATPTYKVAFVEDDDVLNVRNGPSMEYASIGEIPPAAQGIKVVGVCEADWCPIVHRNINGWVNRYYLVVEPLDTAQPFVQTRAASRR